MDKKKLALVLLLIIAVFVVVALFMKKRSHENMQGALTGAFLKENLAKNRDVSESLKLEVIGVINTIEGDSLVITNDSSPLKKLIKDGTSPTVSLKTTEATSVFFMGKGGLIERKKLSDLRVGDFAKVEYDNLTKRVDIISISVEGGEFNE
ncbi:MAG: hypothetical protein WAV73_05925 [Candidatus Moraniibacteriota bacterium]